MSKIREILTARANSETEPERQAELKAAQAELESVLTALEQWRLGVATSGTALMRIMRALRSDV